MNAQPLALELLHAWDHGELAPSISARHPGFDWDDAYAVSRELISLRRARGEKTVGRKIGFTNRNIWPQYGATSPIWHPIYDSTIAYAVDGKATLSLGRSSQPLIEPEIAFKLKAPPPMGCTDPAEILKCIAWYAPSFEIVCCHYPGWKCTPAEFAADSALHWRLVVGTPVAPPPSLGGLATELASCTVDLRNGHRLMDSGKGSNALDHPALALAFLANILARQPGFDRLASGEIITTGTLTSALPVKPGESWQSSYAGLSNVRGIHLTLR